MRVLAEDETVRTKKLKDVGNQEVKDTFRSPEKG
jgi:hypothetical protein